MQPVAKMERLISSLEMMYFNPADKRFLFALGVITWVVTNVIKEWKKRKEKRLR